MLNGAILFLFVGLEWCTVYDDLQLSKVVHGGLQWLTLIYGSLQDLSISNEEFFIQPQ